MYELRNVSKIYKAKSGEVWALNNLSLVFPSKGLIAIKGPSGSGKSTLLNLLSLLEKPSEGKIFLYGCDLARLSKKEIENYRAFACGFIYQHFNLEEDADVLTNIALPLLIEGKKKNESFSLARGLLSKYGLKSLANKKVKLLSGGEKQRVALLRAIIHNPSVIFADEPTGALDEENELLVMKELQEISKTCLVLLVSHNEILIAKYADEAIELKEGKLVSAPSFSLEKTPLYLPKRKSSNFFVSLLIRKNYRKNWSKNLLSIIFGTLGYACLLICFGFFIGSKKTLENEQSLTLDYLKAEISKTTTEEIEGSPLSLTRVSRPLIEEVDDVLKDFPGFAIKNNYSYFFPEYNVFSLAGEKKEGASFIGIEDITLSNREETFLLKGEIPKEISNDICLVNDAFAEKFGMDIIGNTLDVSNSTSVSENNLSETVNVALSFEIIAIVKEFSFLNSPKVYYSYPSLEKHLSKIVLPEISRKENQIKTIVDLVNDASQSSSYGSYSYFLFANKKEDIEALKNNKQSLPLSFSLTSTSWEISDVFTNLTNAFLLSIMPFMMIEVIGVAFILGSLTYSSFLERKKQAAILEALGARKEDRLLIYQSEPVFNAFISSLFSFLLSYPLMKIANFYLAKEVGLKTLVSIPYFSYLGIPFFPILLLLIFSLFIAFISGTLPLKIASSRSLVEELRDE